MTELPFTISNELLRPLSPIDLLRGSIKLYGV